MSCWTIVWMMVQKRYINKKIQAEHDSGEWERRLTAKMWAAEYQDWSFSQRMVLFDSAKHRAEVGQPVQQLSLGELADLKETNDVILANSHRTAAIEAASLRGSSSLPPFNWALVANPQVGRLTKVWKVPDMTTGIVSAKDCVLKVYSNMTGTLNFIGASNDGKRFPRAQVIIHFSKLGAPYDRVCPVLMHKEGKFLKQQVDFNLVNDKISLADLDVALIELRHYEDVEGRFGETWDDYTSTNQYCGAEEQAEFTRQYKLKKQAEKDAKLNKIDIEAKAGEPVAVARN